MDCPGPRIGHGTCPECGAPYQVEAWPFIPSVFNPAIAQRLRDGNLFEFTCASCGYFDLMVYRCLYYDVPNNKLALFEPKGGDRDRAIAILDENLAALRPFDSEGHARVGRLVSHPDELSEKARIFDECLDDRAIEIVKVLFLEAASHADDLFSYSVLYFDKLLVDGRLQFNVSGVEEQTVSVAAHVYDQALAMVGQPSMTPDEAYVIDRGWAYDFLDQSVLAEAESILGR